MIPGALRHFTFVLMLALLASVGVKNVRQAAPASHSIQATWQDGGGSTDPDPGPDAI